MKRKNFNEESLINKYKTCNIHYAFPKLDYLVAGNIVAIFKDPLSQKGYLGAAELIAHEPGKFEKISEPDEDNDKTILKDYTYVRKVTEKNYTIEFAYQRWKVKFLSDDFVTHRKIAYKT